MLLQGTTVTDFSGWLNTHAAEVWLLLLFVVEHAHEVFGLMDKVQVCVAATFCACGENL